jgi:hypothetical protein
VKIAGDGGDVRIPVRTDLAPLVQFLVEETQRRGYRLRAGQCWGYACRKIRNGNSWSNHAWGLAVDINAPANPMKKVPAGAPRHSWTDMPEWLPALWKQHGFGWGGDYRKTKDAMHFEFMGTPTQAAELVQRVKAGAEPAVKPQFSPAHVLRPVIAEEFPAGGGCILVADNGDTYAYGGAQYPGPRPGTAAQHEPYNLEPVVGDAAVGNGVVLVAASGAVYAFGTDFKGGANGRAWFAGRQAARIAAGPKPGGYTITATSGEVYSLPE